MNFRRGSSSPSRATLFASLLASGFSRSTPPSVLFPRHPLPRSASRWTCLPDPTHTLYFVFSRPPSSSRDRRPFLLDLPHPVLLAPVSCTGASTCDKRRGISPRWSACRRRPRFTPSGARCFRHAPTFPVSQEPSFHRLPWLATTAGTWETRRN